MPRKVINYVELNYEDVGAGIPIVCVHGHPFNLALMDFFGTLYPNLLSADFYQLALQGGVILLGSDTNMMASASIGTRLLVIRARSPLYRIQVLSQPLI
ncbi:MAG: hypothetical protein GC179_10865 [Anaerolineaceae bacterium]|nr:hypothetical protein [Anaerolineaceae bacterium]